jgi:2-polyprenyl-6-methoxyphenol hydroxylase-like FAD-dependent oxidoreductase
MSTTPVQIIGGGIGGLALAAALARVGLPCHVHERAPALGEVGAGLALWPNAMRALDALGLGDEARARCVPLRSALLASYRGRVLQRLALDALGPAGDAGSHVIHRADLHALLAGAVPPEAVTTGRACTGVYLRIAAGVAHFADGSRAAGAVIVGADGIHSVVREELWPGTALRYSGQTCYRGVARLPAGYPPGVEPHQIVEVHGPGLRCGICPIDEGRVYWWAALNAPAGGVEAPAARGEVLLRAFDGWPFGLPALIAATSPADILRNDLVDRAPLAAWSRGPATLLGDAAHPMLPNLGQGACTALEDAVVLARCLALHGDDVPAAFAAYEAERRPRTRRLVRDSWRMGRPVRWSHPLAVRLRELALRGVPGALARSALARQLGYDPGSLPAAATRDLPRRGSARI